MVKFVEAEKRGLGGEGSDRRYTPVVMVECAKMSRAMWESLKAQIIRERKRKKEEQEADAEEKRLRKERETRKKQHAMTLEETREKITQMKQDLNDLKKQKHQLFQDLKVVLNEDDTRKRAQQQQNYMKESELMTAHSYSHDTIPLSGHPQMLFQSNLVPSRGPIHSYKVPPSQPQSLVPTGSLKHSCTPSPPLPQPTYQQIYTFKNLPGHLPLSVPVTPKTTKTSSNTSVYVTGQSAYYHGASQPHTNATEYQRGAQRVTYLPPSNPSHPTPSAAPLPTQPPQPREDKHLQPVNLQSNRASHVSSLHQPLDHKSKPEGGGGAFLLGGEGAAGQEKYFQSSVRSHLVLHSAVLPVQQPHKAMPSSPGEWKAVAKQFEKWNFPHCVGAVDGKHIAIWPPKESGSYYFNYKGSHSIVLMAVVKANYEFMYVDVGTNGRISDGGVWASSSLCARLQDGTMGLPADEQLSDSHRTLPYVFVGDDAFPLKRYFMKPFPFKNQNKEQRIFSYRLSRARRVVENAFGIMSNKFRILQSAINLSPQKVEKIVLACTALHNYLRREHESLYTPVGSLDNENVVNGVVTPGAWHGDRQLLPLERLQRHPTNEAKAIRNEFMEYFNEEGAVPWQQRMCGLC